MIAHAVGIVNVSVCINDLVVVQVLHLSDLHVQLGYKEGAPSTCGKFPVCCLQGIGVLHILIPIVVIVIILFAVVIILFAIVIRIVIAIINIRHCRHICSRHHQHQTCSLSDISSPPAPLHHRRHDHHGHQAFVPTYLQLSFKG